MSTSPLTVVAHRALAGGFPENTLAGIEASLQAGAHAVEVDVRATSDGALVLLHDETLERMAGVRRAVAGVSLAELQTLRVRAPGGQPTQPIPTLEDALHLIDGRAAIVVDFVVEEIAPACVDLVVGADAAEWTWWTAHPPRLARWLREACPGSRSFLGWTPREGVAHAPAEAVDLAVRYGLAGLMANHRAIDRTAVEYAHRQGTEVFCWTVNTPRRMATLAALGVDGLTTDYPAAALAVAHRAGRSA